MKFATVAFGLAALSSVIAIPVDSELMMNARALVKRNRAGIKPTIAKRANGGSSSGGNGGITDADIANFALQLEYLEAQYYHIAAFGTQLNQDLLGGKGDRGYVQNNAGNQVNFTSDAVRQYAREIALDEQNHVKALRAALGDAAVAQPEINLDTAFTAAAQAAGLIEKGQTFDPFSSDAAFLTGAFLFEDVGVTAYNGGAPLIMSKDILAAAAGILAVEAYHASEIRTLLFQAGADAQQATVKAAAAISGLLGGGVQGVVVDGQANIVNADENSIAFARTPGQVLNVVFLGGDNKGGFFPRGLNGKITANTQSS